MGNISNSKGNNQHRSTLKIWTVEEFLTKPFNTVYYGVYTKELIMRGIVDSFKTFFVKILTQIKKIDFSLIRNKLRK